MGPPELVDLVFKAEAIAPLHASRRFALIDLIEWA